MQMIEPDYWMGRGRYSKRALSRKTRDKGTYRPPEYPLAEPGAK